MLCKLSTLRVEGHPYSQRDIADMAEEIITNGYHQDPPLVVQWRFSNYFILDGILRFLALSYIAQYSARKVIPKGVECISKGSKPHALH